jgi:hypothetical protein
MLRRGGVVRAATIGLFAAPATIDACRTAEAATLTADEIFPSRFEHLYALTIDDYVNWCTVTVNRGAPSTDPAPAAAPLVFRCRQDRAAARRPMSSTFVWGYWNGTDAPDPDTNQNTTVTMTSDRSVFVCCPFADQTTCP